LAGSGKPTLYLPLFFFIGFMQQMMGCASAHPQISSTVTDRPHTPHCRDSPFLPFPLAAAFFTVFFAAFFTAMSYPPSRLFME
jgi:hypothetical protein